MAPIEMRPEASVRMNFRNPVPSSPRRFSSGTRTFSNTSSRVSEPRRPSLSSSVPSVTPSQPRSTMNAEMPSVLRAFGSVRAVMITVSACVPFVQ